MKITTEMVDYISALSRLKLADAEKTAMAAQLEQSVSYMDVLNTLDTDQIEPMSHVFPVKNVVRPDEAQPSFPREALLKNAPVPDEEAFLSPKAVD